MLGVSGDGIIPDPQPRRGGRKRTNQRRGSQKGRNAEKGKNPPC